MPVAKDDPLAAVIAAFTAPVLARLDEVVRRLDAIDARLAGAKPPAALEPLASILGVSLAAARMRAARDPDLARLGVKVGRRTLYQRDTVLAFLRAREQPATAKDPR